MENLTQIMDKLLDYFKEIEEVTYLGDYSFTFRSGSENYLVVAGVSHLVVSRLEPMYFIKT